ncbi:hypothetical protein [Leptospira weilii]|uniref:Uncharacterized protein n=1 Tax=Leptospira weilii str. UI 13098 TaxID=1088542 RepID=M6QBE3_9LEPT|nr:hypothetical protein [Leptospira weilii]EMN90520.1 hypothetical protein LEP1GSC108_2813 [Leptospira weilii str. UI 13098]
MTEAQRASVTREVEKDVVRYNIIIPNDEANIHLILDEAKFLSLVEAIGFFARESKEKMDV